MKKSFNNIFNVILIVLIAYLAYQKFVVNKPKKDINYKQLVLQTENGDAVHWEDFEGKPMFITFYSSWCAPCMIEMPSIQKLYNHFKDEEIDFFAINTTSLEDIQQFEMKRKIELPQYLLVNSGNIPVKTIPLTYLIDKNGKVVQVVNRPNNWYSSRTRKKIEDLVNKR